MKTVDAYGDLRELGRPIIETREAAARLHMNMSAASHVLRRAEAAGLTSQIRPGLWSLDRNVPPEVVAPYITAPYPAYVSFWSALAKHDMIEQIPARMEIASLLRTKEVGTSLGVFAIHRLAPEVFTGFDGSPATGYMALPEKALFDVVYIRAPRGGTVRLPELTLPEAFRSELLDEWTSRIPRARLRTLVSRGLDSALDQAARFAAADR